MLASIQKMFNKGNKRVATNPEFKTYESPNFKGFADIFVFLSLKTLIESPDGSPIPLMVPRWDHSNIEPIAINRHIFAK